MENNFYLIKCHMCLRELETVVSRNCSLQQETDCHIVLNYISGHQE